MKLTKKTAYGLLGVSIVFELFGTACLEYCNAFTELLPTLGVIVGYALAFWIYSKTLRFLNLCVCYATWTSVGSICSALMSTLVFGQPLSAVGWGAVVTMSIGVFLMNLYGTPKERPEDETVESSAEEGGGMAC